MLFIFVFVLLKIYYSIYLFASKANKSRQGKANLRFVEEEEEGCAGGGAERDGGDAGVEVAEGCEALGGLEAGCERVEGVEGKVDG